MAVIARTSSPVSSSTSARVRSCSSYPVMIFAFHHRTPFGRGRASRASLASHSTSLNSLRDAAGTHLGRTAGRIWDGNPVTVRNPSPLPGERRDQGQVGPAGDLPGLLEDRPLFLVSFH